MAGIEAARAKGRIDGRKPKLGPEQRKAIVELVESGQKIAAEAARIFGVHPSTVSRILAEARLERAGANAARTRSKSTGRKP